MKFVILILTGCFSQVLSANGQATTIKVPSETSYVEPSAVKVNGLLGDVIASSRNGRIKALPSWHDGELITMFSKEVKSHHNKMDWYGEHAGKWLYAASHAARQSGDEALKDLVIKTADYLVAQQEADGYLGNYGPTVRLTNDEISHRRSWDVWNLSYMTLGLLHVNRYYPNDAYLNAAKSIGELFIKMFGDGPRNIVEYGTRRGVSATIIIDPIVELYKATADTRYLALAETVVRQFEAEPDHRLITAGLNNIDMEFVGDGKIYQIIWNLAGIVKLYEVTGNQDYLKAAENIWRNITEYHLNVAGGPWGGVGKHMECFNRKNYWSPYGLVETCSTMAWIQANKELLRITGEARYAQAIERSAYNALLGARFPNGVDWSYHSFMNGSLSIANFNDCCPSSGMLALEELPSMIYARRGNGVAVNLYAQSEVVIPSGKGSIRIKQVTEYPFAGNVVLEVQPARNRQTFPLYLRIPDWAESVTVKVNGNAIDTQSPKANDYVVIDRAWKSADKVEIDFPMTLHLEKRTEKLDGPQNADEIYSINWLSVSRGPLVYAVSGLIDGRDRERALELDEDDMLGSLVPIAPPEGISGPAYRLCAPGIQPLLLVPYFQAGGMTEGGWRLTWLQTSNKDE
jgi:DUF1680 family protein